MENKKKGNLLKGIFTAIIVAAFCFVVSLCITPKDTKVNAGAASNFNAKFSLNDELVKAVDSKYSLIYKDYVHLKNNQLALDLDYSVDCSGGQSNEDEIKEEIDRFNKYIEVFEEFNILDILIPETTLVMEAICVQENKRLEDLSAREQADLLKVHWTTYLAEILHGLLGALTIGTIITICIKVGIKSIPVVGWIIAAISLVQFIATCILSAILISKVQNLANGLSVGALEIHNYCINAYHYMKTPGVSSINDDLSYNFILNGGEASFIEYSPIPTHQKIVYGGKTFYKSVSHNVTAYTMQVTVNEVNKLPAPNGKTWTEFFFPSYYKTVKDSSGNDVKIKIGAGDRTDALFCPVWNETDHFCADTSSKFISNRVANYKTKFTYNSGTQQAAFLALNQGIYTFEFKTELIPIGENQHTIETEADKKAIVIDNNDDFRLASLYGSDAELNELGKLEDATSLYSSQCLSTFNPEQFDEDGNYIGSYVMEKYGIVSIYGNIGTDRILYCMAPTDAVKIKSGKIVEDEENKKLFAAKLGYSDKLDATIKAAAEKFVKRLKNIETTSITASILLSSLSNQSNPTLSRLRLLNYIDGAADEDAKQVLVAANSAIRFIIDKTNPYAPDITVNSSAPDTKYSNSNVTLKFSINSTLSSKYSGQKGDAVTYFDVTDDMNFPDGVDGMAPESGVVGYKYTIIREPNSALISVYNNLILEINNPVSSMFSYRWRMKNGKLAYGTNPAPDDIGYGDITDWMSALKSFKFQETMLSLDDWNDVTGDTVTFKEDGFYYVFAVAIDFAGNVSGVSAVSFTIDTVTPMLDISVLKNNEEGGTLVVSDAEEQLLTLKGSGYYKDGYVISRSEIKYIDFNVYDIGQFSSGVNAGYGVKEDGSYGLIEDLSQIKICVSYLANADVSNCLDLENPGSSLIVPQEPVEGFTTSLYNSAVRIYRDANMYTVRYMLTDNAGNDGTNGSSSGPFRVHVKISDIAGNEHEVYMLFVSNIEKWTIQPEAETIIDFDFNNDENPISKLNVNLVFPEYKVNNDDMILNLNDPDIMIKKYMLVGASDRVQFYDNWYQFEEVCVNNPNDTRCGRKVTELKDRFINIIPSGNIVELLSDNDDLYENQYIFQHFQIRVPTINNEFYYVLLQEFEYSTDDMIKQLGFATDDFGKDIGNNQLEASFNLNSTTNDEIRLKYTDYSELVLDSKTLTNYNYMDKFTLSFDIMQLAIESPESTSRAIVKEYNLNLKVAGGELNKKQSAGDFIWLTPENRENYQFHVATFTRNFIDVDENGHLVYYMYLRLTDYAEIHDLGPTYAVDNIKFVATKNNAILGSTKDYTSLPGNYIVDASELDNEDSLFNPNNSKLTSNINNSDEENTDGKIFVPLLRNYSAKTEGLSKIIFDLGFVSWDLVKESNFFDFYYKDGSKYLEIANPSKIHDCEGSNVEGIEMCFTIGKVERKVFARLSPYVYFESLILEMNMEELFKKYRYNPEVKIVQKVPVIDGNTVKLDENNNIVYEIAYASNTPITLNNGNYEFVNSSIPDAYNKNKDALAMYKQVYIEFSSYYIEVTSYELFTTLVKKIDRIDYIENGVESGVVDLVPTNIYIQTISEQQAFALSNRYNLYSSGNDKSYLSIYTNYENTDNLDKFENNAGEEVDAIPNTGEFVFGAAMGANLNQYRELSNVSFYDYESEDVKKLIDSNKERRIDDVYWTNSSTLSFELKNNDYGYSYIFGPSLKYQYGVIPVENLSLEMVIALFASYNNIDLMNWFTCADSTNLQCVTNIETIKASIISEYIAASSDAHKYKINEYIRLNNASINSINKKVLYKIGAYSIEYDKAIAKAFLTSTTTLYRMLAHVEKTSGVYISKEEFVTTRFEYEIHELRNGSLPTEVNNDYYYRNYYLHENGDYRYKYYREEQQITLDDLYANALVLYMNHVSELGWREQAYCYVSNNASPCTLNSTGIIEASDLVADYSDKQYVLVYRVIDALGRTSLNYKTIHFFNNVPQITVEHLSEIFLDRSPFYSETSGEATLNLANLEAYLFGNNEGQVSYITKWFPENSTFINNLASKKVCIIENEASTCNSITNDKVISMEIGKQYRLQFTLVDKAGNELVVVAPFYLIYNKEPTFDIEIENSNVFSTNKNVNVAVQYRSVAGLDYDRSLTTISLENGSVVDASNGVYYLDLSEYHYSGNEGIYKNGAIKLGTSNRWITIYSDADRSSYSDEFKAFLDGITFENNLLANENGFYFNVNKEGGVYILLANMTKPIQKDALDVGRTRVYSEIINVTNIDTTAPIVSFDNQFSTLPDFITDEHYFSSQSVILYVKDKDGVGISSSNINFVSVKPVNAGTVCAHEDKACIAEAFANMSSVPALNQVYGNDYISVDVTPNNTRPGLTTYYVSVRDDLENVAYFRYDVQVDTTAPVIDLESTYISELDENGFVQSYNINIVFNSIKESSLLKAVTHEVNSPLDKIVIKERVVEGSEEAIETTITCDGNCDSTMTIPYTVRNEKVNLTLALYDVAGNKSADYTLTVRIDSLNPELTADVRSNLDKITNDPVKVLIVATDNFSFYDGTFEDEDGITHYDIEVMINNSGIWERINNNYEYIIRENGVYRFRANDMAKNFTEKEIVVTNIDNKAPNLTFTPDGAPAAQSQTISMNIVDDLSYIKAIRYCWVTVGSNIKECTSSVSGYVSVSTSGNETEKTINITQNTGEGANPDGEYVLVVYVADEWGNEKHYVSNVFTLDSKKPSITPDQSLVSDSTKAVLTTNFETDVEGASIYLTELTITDSNNIAHLLSNKARVTITGEGTKEVLGQWVSGLIDSTPLASPVDLTNVFVNDSINGDYYYLRFSTTYEDSTGTIQTAVVFMVVHIVDKSAPNITLISSAPEIAVDKEGLDFQVPGIYINDINDGTLQENVSLRSVFFFGLGEYIPTLEELEADMNLVTHEYIKYSSNTHLSIKTVGTYLIHYIAVDEAGNQSVALRRIDIVDDIAPAIKFENKLTIENFIFVKEEEKRFNVHDYLEIIDNYDELTSENVEVIYEYKSAAGAFAVIQYNESSLEVLGYHRFTYTIKDSSGNESVYTRLIHTVNVEIKYINGEVAGEDVSLAENDSFIIKGGVRIKENGLTVLINDMPIDEMATPVNISGEIHYEYSANGRQDVKLIDDIGNEVVYSLYMVKIDELNPEEQTELKVLIDKNLITSTKQIVASAADFTPNYDENGNAVSYTIYLNDYNVNIGGADATSIVGEEKVPNSIVFALFCDNVVDNGGVACSTNYLELTLEGKMLNTSSSIPLTEITNAITFSVAEYNNMVANGNKIVMLVMTTEDAKKVETYVEPVVEDKKLSSSSVSTMVLFGVPSCIGLFAVLRVLKFKKSVKTV